jgi:ACS family hexuronate transporter-like MFS transporter
MNKNFSASPLPVDPADSGKLPRMRWVMITMAFLATVLNYVHRLSFANLSATGNLRHMITDEAFGYIATAFFIAYMISNAVSGFVIDRLGTRIGYSLCMACWTTAALLHAVASSPFQFGLFRFLLGIGEAGNWPAAIKLTDEWFSPEERSTATGIFNSGAAIGAVVAPPLIVWMGISYGWQASFVLIGLLGYAWLAAFWFLYYTPGKSVRKSTGRIIPPWRLLKTKFVSWLFVSKFFMDPIWYFITFWIARYLVDVHGWGLSKIGSFSLIPFLMADIGNILGGLFTQHMIRSGIAIPKARKITAAVSGLIVAFSLLSGPLLIHSGAMAIGMLAVTGFGHAAYTSNTMAFPADVVPADATASVWGLVSVGAGLGGAFFQSVSGIAVHRISQHAGYASAYNTVFVGYGFIALIGLAIVLFLIGPLVPDKELHDYTVAAPGKMTIVG